MNNLQVAISQQTLIDVQSDPNLFLLIHDGNKIQIGSIIELVLMEDSTAKPLDPPFIVEITRLNKYGLKPEQVQIFFDRYSKPVEEPEKTFIGELKYEFLTNGPWLKLLNYLIIIEIIAIIIMSIKCL